MRTESVRGDLRWFHGYWRHNPLCDTVSVPDTVLLIKYRQRPLQPMPGSGVQSILLWLVVVWLFAVGLFLALLYASGKRDQREQARA